MVFVYSEGAPRLLQANWSSPPLDSRPPTVQFRNLAPGAYRVFALDDPGDLEWRRPGALDEFLSSATTITLGPGEQGQLQVQVIHVKK